MTLKAKFASTLLTIGALAGCGSGGAPASAPAASTGGARAGASGQAAQPAHPVRMRWLNTVRPSGHHNARRPRHVSAG